MRLNDEQKFDALCQEYAQIASLGPTEKYELRNLIRDTTLRIWRPIESAPKDGAHILAAAFDDSTGFGWFDGVKVPFQDVVHWFQDGFYASTYGVDQPRPFDNLTHWMSLTGRAKGE